jgi:hypothetical protein
MTSGRTAGHIYWTSRRGICFSAKVSLDANTACGIATTILGVPNNTPCNGMPQLYISPMNRSNVQRKQGDSRDLDRQYQSSPRKPWPAESDRVALRRHSNASAVYSTTSSTAANEDIHEPRIKSPERTVSGLRGAHCLTRGMLPPPCPPQEPNFAFLDCTETDETGACSTDHTISTVENIMLDQDKSAEHQMILLTPGQWLRWRGAVETLHAIQHDKYEPCLCLDCGRHVFCLSDAWLVLCPHCYSISPVEHNDASKSASLEGGIGLGFTIDTLFEVQASVWRDY